MNNDNFKKHEEWLEEKDIMIFSYCRKKDEQCENDYRIFDLSDVDEWSNYRFHYVHECYYDVTLINQAYKNYWHDTLPEQPIMERSTFIDNCINDKKNFCYIEYYRPLLREEKLKRIIE